MKKAELSVNIVVVAAIAVIILVILTVLILRSLGGFGDQATCESMDGFGSENQIINGQPPRVVCAESCGLLDAARYVKIANECSGPQQECCLRVSG